MRQMLRYCLGLTFAIVVALSSFSQAQARHHAHGASTMVICTGYGLVRITIDAEGNPVEQSLPCPDCLPFALALLPTLHTDTFAPVVALTLPMVSALPLRAEPRGLWPLSRAPPFPA